MVSWLTANDLQRDEDKRDGKHASDDQVANRKGNWELPNLSGERPEHRNEDPDALFQPKAKAACQAGGDDQKQHPGLTAASEASAEDRHDHADDGGGESGDVFVGAVEFQWQDRPAGTIKTAS